MQHLSITIRIKYLVFGRLYLKRVFLGFGTDFIPVVNKMESYVSSLWNMREVEKISKTLCASLLGN